MPLPVSNCSIFGRPSPPRPATLGALASPARFGLVVFVWVPPESSQQEVYRYILIEEVIKATIYSEATRKEASSPEMKHLKLTYIQFNRYIDLSQI